MREKLIEALFGEGGLLRVRALLAFVLVGALVCLSVQGKIDAEVLQAAAVAALGFYFGTRAKG